jgi:hypothetical protein
MSFSRTRCLNPFLQIIDTRIYVYIYKVKSSLCLSKHHAMKTYWGSGLHAFLTSALDGGEWSASWPSRFTPRERASGIHWIGGWMGPRAVLDAVVMRKIPSPRRELNLEPRSSSL